MDYWYQTASFYHLYTFALCNAPRANAYGTVQNRLREIERWIPHIKEMGCSAVCFSPVFKSRTHGYDTTDYLQIDNRIGANEDFRALVQELRRNGLRVVLDGVFNHCGRDFFAFRDVCENGAASKYCSWFSGLDFSRSGPAGDPFTYDTWNGYCELVKLNLKNPDVREYLFGAVRFWIEYFGIDGLRLDAADCLDFGFMRELRRETAKIREDFWLMGEVVHGDYTKWANGDTLHSVTNYEAYKGLYSSHNDKNLFEIAYSLSREFDSETGIYKGLPLYNFVDNHDQNRLASTVCAPALYTIYILLYTMPGIPALYYGSEWGLKGVKTSDSDEQLRPYIDVGDVCAPEKALEGVIKKLSRIRNQNSALVKGGYRQILCTYEQQFAFERVLGNEKIIVAINTGEHNAAISLHGTGFYDLLNEETVRAGDLVLYPHWGRILRPV